LCFRAAMRSNTGAGRTSGRALTGSPFNYQFSEGFLMPVAEDKQIEAAGFALDDHAGDRHSLGIKLALEAVKLRCPDFLGGAQRDQRESLAPWLDQHYALAAAEREASQTGHADRGADRAIGLGR